MPSILIFYSIFILKKWIEENNFNEDLVIAIGPTKYSNNELAL